MEKKEKIIVGNLALIKSYRSPLELLPIDTEYEPRMAEKISCDINNLDE